MAQIIPFRALHYNSGLVGDLANVVTQPYDKISPEMQARYYGLSPYNLARIIRRKGGGGRAGADADYQGAAQDFRDWIDRGVLVSDGEPALYVYHQQYEVPGRPGDGRTRRGFIGLGRLEDYGARIVHRHEETLSGPKADRLELLKATRAHFGQIFLLYSDPEGCIEHELDAYSVANPWERVEDEYGTVHSVWRLADPLSIERVVGMMGEKKLVIADGHHRYETALAYRDLRRGQGGDDRAEYVMATFVRMETDGLTILPTHRVVHSLAGFDWTAFCAAADRFFEVKAAAAAGPESEWGAGFAARLAEAGRDRPALGAYAGPGRLAVLRLRPDADLTNVLADVPPGQRRLDVVLLHRLILQVAFGIDRQAVSEERNLRYVRELRTAAEQVESGEADICFLMNATPMKAVRDNAFAGDPLPQKSTDFYPKLLSGVTIYWLDNPAGI
ncbi:MAG TPA: DUF1015 domain-containing protein [Terriglobia bacterium]|nr:DUF1015 domain-containing protein [Terriglobia bacterium]